MGKTQVEVAAMAHMSQTDLSKLERRADMKLSTLKRYVAAMGGNIELVAVFQNGRRISLDV
jgi:hypothetical protein